MLPLFTLLYYIVFLAKLVGATNPNNTQCPYINVPPIQNNVKTTRIMQYNVEWLFLKTYNNCPGSGCSWNTLSDAQIHLGYLASVIESYNPDIINLCEVEGCYELEQLNTDLGGVYTPYLLYGTDSATGQNVGMLTKLVPSRNLTRTDETHSYPISGSRCGSTSTGTTGVSKHYYTAYNINGKTIYMVGAHLLAFPTDASRCSSREAQASIIQHLVYELLSADPGAELILLGDFNDYDAEVSDSNSDKPISMVLDILKGLTGTYAGKYILESAASKVGQTQRYTSWWDPNGDCESTLNEMSMIDHILMTPGLMGRVNQVLFPHPYTEYCGTYNSDHFPVIVDIDW
jgi:endonuclease/exonuclease/phosphatase family metal-dependent hydrolase